MIGQVWAWLADPGHWTGREGLLARIVEHLVYTGAALALAALVALPLGLWVGHTRRGRWLISGANALRAVPTLGLLFATALFLGPYLPGDTAFLVPGLIVFVVLAMPPLLSGTYAGVEAVDLAARDAARGMGMTPAQVLFRVEFPCALPLILSGVRGATLQVVSTAVIAAYISLGGLGVYLAQGLASGDYPMVAGGAIVVTVLAMLLDILLAVLTPYAVSPGLRAGADRGRPDPASSAIEGSARPGDSAPGRG
ncbi:MAG: ABC transporter permease [Dermatophilaceae bacterium]